MANVYINQGFHWIVATCAFCGRWRDSLGEWHVPPKMVEVLVESQIVVLSHTYCPPCLREKSDTMGGRFAIEAADREDQRRQLRPYDPDDLVYNLCVMRDGGD